MVKDDLKFKKHSFLHTYNLVHQSKLKSQKNLMSSYVYIISHLLLEILDIRFPQITHRTILICLGYLTV